MGTQTSLRPHQDEAVEFIKKRKISYLADDMGLGKTISAIASIKETDSLNVIIVCPAYLKDTWKDECHNLGIRDIQIIRKRKDIIEHKRLTIVGYDNPTMTKVFTELKPYDMLIFDEAHYLNGRKSGQTKICLGTDRRMKKSGTSFAKRVVFLSGTPMLNGPYELWPFLQTVYPKTFRDFHAYIYRYCGAYQGDYGLEYKGATNQDELKPYIDKVMLRRKKSDILNLPPKMYKTITLEKNKQVEKHIKTEYEFKLTVEQLLESNGSVIGEYATLRRELGVLKYEASKKYISDFQDRKMDIIVFTYHKDVAKLISKNAITGEIPTKNRQTLVKDFQQNGGMLVGTYGAMGTGFTLTRASVVILLELHYSPMIVEQAIDRAYRIGQDKSITVHTLLWDSGIERKLYSAMKSKKKKFNYLFENNIDK